MKYYVFLTSTIARVGGAQLYIARKCDYLIDKGWSVIICHFNPGDIMIEFNVNIRTELIYELGCSPSLFSIKHINRILNRIIKCEVTDNIVIESHSVNLAYWGEILTSKFSTQHLIYLLSENLTVQNQATYDYLNYKYQNNSLFGITPVSLKQIFKSDQEYWPFLNAIGCTSKNTENTPNKLMNDYKKSDWNILSIGRLEKDYIIPTFKALANYANCHKDKTISLIIVGGSYHKKNRKNAIRIFKDCKNVSVIDIGYVWPIPLSCFNNSDLTIASSGSAIIAESVGSPTIVIDGRDLKPIGIYKKTTDSFVFRKQNEPPILLASLLDDILIVKKFVKNIHPEKNEILDFSPHMQKLENILTDNYPVDKLFTNTRSFSKKLIILILGARRYLWACNLVSSLKNSITIFH